MSDEERFRNAVIYGTSHPEMYKTPEEEIERLRAENEKLRAALDCFLEQSTPTQWRYSRERAEKLAKGILAAAALKGDK